ncbi:MAG: chemotaxis protein CheA [Nitrospirota bacterium]
MKNKQKKESYNQFISEAEEIIAGVSENLVVLESADDKVTVNPEVINSIFRAAHTLKGMSGMVGLTKISETSHRLEDMLDNMRMGRLQLNSAVLDTLFEGMDVLSGLINSVSTKGSEDIDISPFLEKIEKVIKGEGKEQDSSSSLEDMGFGKEITNVLTEYEVHRLLENIKQNINIYEINTTFKLDTFDKDLTAINSKIQDIGEIITSLPVTDTSLEGSIGFNIITGTKIDYNELSSILSSEKNVKIRPVDYKKKEEKIDTSATVKDTTSIKSLTQTLRVDINKLDNLLNIVGELVLTKAIISQTSKELISEYGLILHAVELQKASLNLHRRVAELQEGLIEVRMVPIGQVFDRLIRIVRKTSKELQKEIDLQISGEDTQLDKSMVEEIADPLMHLVRNAIDHAIESKEERIKAGKSERGIIKLNAGQKGNNVVIEVEDDGKGIDMDRIYQKGLKRGLIDSSSKYDQKSLLDLLFMPGFSTAKSVTEISGRGVGLDVVAKNVTHLKGMIDIKTEHGKGTKFTISLPITLIIIKALIVKVGKERYAIPISSVSESLMIEESQINTVENREVIQLRDYTLALLRLSDIFELHSEEKGTGRVYVIVVGLAEKRVGLIVDALEGQHEIVIKSIGEILKKVPGIAGATELGNRKTILVLDIASLIDEVKSPTRK